MKAQEYIISQLSKLKEPTFLDLKINNQKEMIDTIFNLLMSKKFRKYSVPEKNQIIIRTAIEKNVLEDEPIKISWPFGGYKLWRLEETPEPDWAELFTIIYIVKWLKTVCAIYPKGVEFTFWVDEVVISQMNNIPQEDLDTYQKKFAEILEFIKAYIPTNLKFEVFLERWQYENNNDFNAKLAIEIEKLTKSKLDKPTPLTEAAIRSIEMNTRVTSEQEKDPLWRDKVDTIHNAYYILQEKQSKIRPPYTTKNISAFTIFFEPNVIPIGSTKTSIVRFWVGVGVLQKREESYIETILSITQMDKTKATWEHVKIDGLSGKNFSKIRII